MTVSLVGKKCGMTRIFTEEGISIPVTVLEVLPNTITQIKTKENDGYDAIQVTTGFRKRSRINKPEAGHYVKANVEPGRSLWELPIETAMANTNNLNIGAELTIEHVFKTGELVDVTGITKGKGFAGTIKRHHFSGQDKTHGNSRSHRVPGSIGQRQSPGKVFKGKKMCGHLGNVQRTILSQKIIKIDAERNLILISGAVPGASNGDVIIRSAIKANKKDKHQSGGE